MKRHFVISIVLLLLAAQAPSMAAELAVLRNGFSIHCERREQIGDVVRLYTATGFVDVPASEIASFEKDEMPVATAVTAPVSVNQPALPQVSPTAGQKLPMAFTPEEIQSFVREASERNRLDPDFVNSVIKAESGFYPKAVSRKGAQGLMQLMPSTAAMLGVADPFDPKANIEGGTAHLSQLLDRYHDDPAKALAAYNAGAHRVDQYHGVPPYMETRAYVRRIINDFNAKKRARMKAEAAAKKPSTATTAKKTQQAAADPSPSGNN